MLRKPLFLILLVAGCSKGPNADLPSIGEARSLAAEWALVNQEAAAGHLNSTYVATMHKQLREQLQSASSALTQPKSDYAVEVRALLDQSDDASPETLRAHARKLKQIEDHLESA
jgi:phosphate uptake regulator